MGLLNKLAPSSIVAKLAQKWVAGWLTDAAEGKHGEGWAKAYAWLQGRKAWTGALLALLGALAHGYGYAEAGAAVATLGSVLLAAGLADKALRSDPPLWADWVVYRWLVGHAPNVAALLGLAAAYVWGGGCAPLHLAGRTVSCAAQAEALGLAAALLVYARVVDVAMLADAPLPQYVRDRLGRVVER